MPPIPYLSVEAIQPDITVKGVNLLLHKMCETFGESRTRIDRTRPEPEEWSFRLLTSKKQESRCGPVLPESDDLSFNTIRLSMLSLRVYTKLQEGFDDFYYNIRQPGQAFARLVNAQRH